MALFFAANPFNLLDFPLDDAWIHRVYSQAFAYGNGFEYNPGQPEAGSTSPLWSIVSAPAHWLEPVGTDAVVLAVKLIGLALALCTVEATRRIGRHLGNSPIAGIIAASVLALDPRLAFSALSGMETPLLLALWTGAALCLTNRRFALAVVFISLAPTARPEALVILPFFVIAAVLAVIRRKMEPRKLGWLLLLPVPMLAWVLFCKYANGHWLPTTFYMKSTSPTFGFDQLTAAWRLLGLNGPLPSLIVAPLVAASGYLLLRRHHNPDAFLLLLAAPIAFLLGVLYSREFFLEGYYWLRWTDPAAMLITATAATGLGICAASCSKWKIRMAIGLLLLLCLPHFAMAATAWRTRLISDCRAIHLITVQAGKWIDENTPKDAVVAVNDAGATRYFGKRKTIDLMGLNCADLAFSTVKKENHGIVDYLAITPTWFVGKGLYDEFPECTHFAIPPEEYTITPNKGQREIVIFKCTQP